MSAWRREALERLPECRESIVSARNSMALWIELLDECGRAFRQRNEDLIRRLYEYARWCRRSPSIDVRTAVVCAFYEHLPLNPIVRRDMPRRFDRAEFTELREVFLYHLSPDKAVAFEQEYLEGERRLGRERQ